MHGFSTRRQMYDPFNRGPKGRSVFSVRRGDNEKTATNIEEQEEEGEPHKKRAKMRFAERRGENRGEPEAVRESQPSKKGRAQLVASPSSSVRASPAESSAGQTHADTTRAGGATNTPGIGTPQDGSLGYLEHGNLRSVGQAHADAGGSGMGHPRSSSHPTSSPDLSHRTRQLCTGHTHAGAGERVGSSKEVCTWAPIIRT